MQTKVVTIGLGYIGLPTSALIANNNIAVHGVDISQYVVDTINAGKIHIVEPDLDKAVANAVAAGYLKAGTKAVVADTYLIVVPTPFKGDHQPDISYVQAATEGIIPLLKQGDLYIIESTSPVGTTEKMMELIFSKRPELEGKISLAYCPERVLPGNVMYELVHNDRVIGGVDEASTQKAIAFYSQFVKGELHPTNARTAEMCKLTENSSRDVQIAFANELSLICDKAGINVWELINLANKHPRVNILQPGCGVGGHCIAVDPYFITAEFPMESRMIAQARMTNNYKPFWCAEKVKTARLEFELKHGRQPSIALMGLAFKPNIDDLRESPAIHIVERVLQDSGDGDIYIVEPNVQEHKVFKVTDYKEAVEKADIVVLLVAHNEFKELAFKESQVVLDFCGVINKEMQKTLIITGGAGFIGSHVVREFVTKYPDYTIVNLDKLTYAGNLENLKDIEQLPNYHFEKVDICDAEAVLKIFKKYQPTGVIHLAAESHVDRSISNPLEFVMTNVIGTVNLLNAAKHVWAEDYINKRFHHVSTDEVYGTLGNEGFFTEETSYDPHSPYSASKASSDHFVRAYADTYGMPIVITNCSNNYGPNHFPEKLIPLCIHNIIHNKPLPIYGDGKYTRDWLFVIDHAKAIDVVFHNAKNGTTYNIGGFNEWRNIDLVKELCKQMDNKLGREIGASEKLITFVKDRPGHDLRYAIDATKIKDELGWYPSVTFEEGLAKTIDWFMDNQQWLDNVTSGDYQKYYEEQYK